MTKENVDLIAAILAAGVLAATGLNIIQEQDAVDRWIKIRNEINNNLRSGKLLE
jgi:type II secretory pathway component PulF